MLAILHPHSVANFKCTHFKIVIFTEAVINYLCSSTNFSTLNNCT